MRSDVISVSSGGEGFAEALEQAERTAAFKGLDKKESLHLCLLTEEMMGIMRALTGEREADFWIDSDGGELQLHLAATTDMTAEKRRNLLSVSTSGVNAAARGVTGKLRDLFDRLLEPGDSSVETALAMSAACGFTGADLGFTSPAADVWSLGMYMNAVRQGQAPRESWDELEKSVVARLADDVRIGISGSKVEMTIIKKI